MNILAISGSPRKSRATETLIDEAIKGVRSIDPEALITKVCLIDYDIRHCLNCLKCRDTETEEPYVRCTIRDDMDRLYDIIDNADAYIIGNPLHSGYVTGLISVFLERIVWCFAEPKGSVMGIRGIPKPRNPKLRRLGTIITNAKVPPAFKMFCNDAEKQIKAVMKSCLNAKATASLYAGAIELRGVERYMTRAYNMGQKLAG